MSKHYKVAITNDTELLRCRLLIKLIELCGARPVLIEQFLPNNLHKENYCDIDFTPLRNEALEIHLSKVRKQLDSCDAVIIPGNSLDVPPSAYGELEIHPETKKRLPKTKLNVRFETETFMADYAIKQRQIPLLGICGGLQVVNVALGGTLIQHIPDLQLNIAHKDLLLSKITKIKEINWERKFENHILTGMPKGIFPKSHEMQVTESSILAEIYRSSHPNIDLSKIYELSIHHQGCLEKNIAKGLKIAAIAADGIIEAMELEEHMMCLLVQFHLECNVSKIALPAIERLFTALK